VDSAAERLRLDAGAVKPTGKRLRTRTGSLHARIAGR
jgi:hypothetical protein